MTEFFAYIDESGDEGVGKGRQWFALAAVIVEAGKQNSLLGQTLAQVKQTIDLKKPVLHWTDLSHLRKEAVSHGLAKANIVTCAVLVDTWHPKIANSTLLAGRMYFYAFRWLAERITWYCADRPGGGKVRLRPENKGGISHQELKDYLSYIQKRADCQIRPDCIIDVKTRAKSQLPLLQVADVVAGATTNAFEHQYGVTAPTYLLNLKNTLYRRKTRLWGYGLKFMPHEASSIPMQLTSEYLWLAQLESIEADSQG